MSWDRIRKEYQPLILEIQRSIDDQLKLWAETGDNNHYLFAQHQIKHLKEIKDHVTNLEKEEGIC